MFNIYITIMKSEKNSMMSLKYYFSYKSFIRKKLAEIFLNVYELLMYFLMIDLQSCLGLIMMRGMIQIDHF